MADDFISVDFASLNSNLAKLEKVYANMERTMQRKMLKEACQESVAVMLPVAKQLAPVETGALRDSLRVYKKVSMAKEYAVAGVFADKEYQSQLPDGSIRKPKNYLHLVEYGTKSTPPRAFMRTAFNASVSLALSIAITKFEEAINQACPTVSTPSE